MCKYCDKDSNSCEIFIDLLDMEYYLDVPTSQWDNYLDDYIHERVYIFYCPYCGRKL